MSKEHGWTFQCGSKGSVCTDCGDACEDDAVFVKGTDYLCCQCAKHGMNVYCQDLNEQALHIKGLEASADSLRQACNDTGALLDAARDKLADPQHVHMSMLRGTIAKPNVGQLRHLYPELTITAEGE